LSTFLGFFIQWLIIALNVAILGRVIMSWISPGGSDPLSSILFQITEPILKPIRKVVPSMGMFDLSPMVALILLNFVIFPVLRAAL
jgi:YggT family protein